jgi:hypothetical protein
MNPTQSANIGAPSQRSLGIQPMPPPPKDKPAQPDPRSIMRANAASSNINKRLDPPPQSEATQAAESFNSNAELSKRSNPLLSNTKNEEVENFSKQIQDNDEIDHLAEPIDVHFNTSRDILSLPPIPFKFVLRCLTGPQADKYVFLSTKVSNLENHSNFYGI